MDDMIEELIDRFGDIPRKVQQLLNIAGLKALAHSAYVTAVEQKGDAYQFTMYEKAKVQPQKIPGLLQAYHGSLVLDVYKRQSDDFSRWVSRKRASGARFLSNFLPFSA